LSIRRASFPSADPAAIAKLSSRVVARRVFAMNAPIDVARTPERPPRNRNSRRQMLHLLPDLIDKNQDGHVPSELHEN
jgi:hypothetical protein